MYATLRVHVTLDRFRELRRTDDYRFFNTVISHYFHIFDGSWAALDRGLHSCIVNVFVICNMYINKVSCLHKF